MKSCSSKELKRQNYLISEIENTYHEMSLKLGISDSAMVILYAVCDSKGCCPLQEICRRSGVSKQTLNSALRKLEQEDIVYMESAGSRTKNVCLTPKGRQLANVTAVRMIEAENAIFASWTKEEVETYLSLTEKFLTALREKVKEL